MAINIEQIKHIAKLARLDLSKKEIETYQGQLDDILEYINLLNEVDVSDIEPTAQVTGLDNILREDKSEDWEEKEREAALKEAPENEERFIRVKRVLD